MTKLDDKIFALQDKITGAGNYIAAVCEGITNEGMIRLDNNSIIDDPIKMADDVIKTAHEVKEMAIQYQALTELDNKKAADSDQTTTPGTDND